MFYRLYRLTKFISLTHKRAERRAPMWGSEFTIKVAYFKRAATRQPIVPQAQANC
jgi:hypothetical protein